MSIAVTFCPGCGTQSADGAQFCGKCGKQFPSQSARQSQPASPAGFTQPKMTSPTSVVQGDWKGMAGIICGVLSFMMCGPFTAIPGIMISWMDLSAAKATGRSTTIAKIGIGLNVFGMILSLGVVFIMIMLMALGSSGGGFTDPYMGYY